MIHGRDHRPYRLTIGKAEDGNLRTGQKFFNDDLRTALSEDLVLHDRGDGIECFLLILCNDNALAQRQTIRLDDSRILVLVFQISLSCFRIIEYTIFCGRNVILLHQFLGKHLAAFQNCRIFLGTKGHKALCLHGICHAQNQRIIRCNKDQIYFQLFCQLDHAVNIGCLYRKALGILGNTAVAGCAVQRIYLRTLCQFHDDGVFSSAAADN